VERKGSARRYGFFALIMLTLIIGVAATAGQSWAKPTGQDGAPDAPNQVYLPLVAGGAGSTSDTEIAPQASGEEALIQEGTFTDQTGAPELPPDNPQAATCSTYIRFNNYSSQKIYVYWKKSSSQEVLYKTLSAGSYYWQQSYYGNGWVVRDGQGNQLKAFTVNTCFLVYVTIDNGDFPNPTPTPVACDARIDRIRLLDFATGVQVPGLDPISNGATINLSSLPAKVVIEAVAVGSTESVVFSVNGDQLIENLAPYNYPATGAGVTPVAGSFTVVAKAYSQDNGGGTLCDTKQVNFTIVNGGGATATPTPVATNTPSAPASCPGNLALNSGFENGFTNWDVSGYTSTQLTLSNDAYSGTQAALLRGPGGVYVSQPIDVIPGATYVVSAFTKTNNPSIFQGVGLNFYDSLSNRLGQTYVQATSAAYAGSSNSFTAPLNTLSIVLYMYTDGGSNFLVDNICVTRSGGPTPTRLPSTDNVKIGDRVWVDANRNGIQDEGGSGLAGVTVELLEGCTSTETAATRVTSNSGQYLFTNLAPGQYRIRFIAPNDDVFTVQNQGSEDGDSDADADGITDCITLAPGAENFDVDAGVFDPSAPIPTPTPTATPLGGYIGDRVWNDQNRDGIQDGGEPSVQGVTVELLQGCTGSTVLLSRVTSNSGQYLFGDLLPGQYRVRALISSPYVFSPQNAGSDDNGDSDVDSSGVSACIVLDPFEQDPSVDIGIYDPAGPIPTPTNTPAPLGGYIGDRVWNDLNQDGTQDAGETNIQGLTVELLSGCSGTAVLATRTTSNSGQYLFGDLPAGQYRVRTSLPGGFVFSAKDQGGDDFADSDVDSSGVTDCINLSAFQEVPYIDIGMYDPTLPTPTNTPVGLPTNTPVAPTATATNTPVAPPTATATNTTVPPTATATNTAVPPTATKTPVPPTATPTKTPVPPTATPVCDARIDRLRFVNFDSGLPVAGLDPIPNGATINFSALPVNFVIEAIAVGSTESVRFVVNGSAVNENALPYNYPNSSESWQPTAGAYTVAATAYTQDNAGGQACGSKQVSFTLAGSRLGSIGDRVWKDQNRNGKQDSGEAGVSSVYVQLWKDTNKDGHHDTLVATTTTGSNGSYRFDNVEPGVVYVVKFSLPYRTAFTSPNVGNDEIDSDVEVFSYGGTGNIILAPGESKTNVDAGIYYY